jgi:hypothetical protein
MKGKGIEPRGAEVFSPLFVFPQRKIRLLGFDLA